MLCLFWHVTCVLHIESSSCITWKVFYVSILDTYTRSSAAARTDSAPNEYEWKQYVVAITACCVHKIFAVQKIAHLLSAKWKLKIPITT